MGIGEAKGPLPADGPAYVFDNAGVQATTRFAALSAVLDPGTVRHLEDRGVGRGWHCLEVGGGGGSIATWLADRVGPTGHVLVTDIDPRFLESLKLPNLEVQRHNIATDSLPEAAFDLVHSRLVLMHLPEREKALASMIAALKPGGWLIGEEFDSCSMPSDTAVSPGEVLLKTHVAMTRFVENRGVDRRFGRLLFGRLRAHGLLEVGAEARTFVWQCGSPGTSFMRANYEQLRGDMIKTGYINEEEFEQDLAQLEAVDFFTLAPIMWAAWGRRPPT